MLTSITEKGVGSAGGLGGGSRGGKLHTLVGSVVALVLHAGQGLSYPLEQRLDVVADLGACLDEDEIVFLGLLLSLLGGDFPLVVEIGLVADEDDNDIRATLAADIVYPFPGLLEGLLAGDVVHDNGDAGVADV